MVSVSAILENTVALVAFSLCAAIGLITVLRSMLSLMSSFTRHFLRAPYNHFQRYAKDKDSFVVVTGGSDGIGFEICDQMAEQGFNVSIISRTLAKIEIKLKELQVKYPKIQTKAVAFDFSKNAKISDYKEKIGDQLKDIDIAMLFLNAGHINIGNFHEMEDQEIQDSIMINSMQPVFTMKVLVDQMIER